MTSIQERRVEEFKNKVLTMYGYPETKEFKRCDVSEDEFGTVHLFCTVGMIGDEGTMAAVLCRDTYSVFIGKKGGYRGVRPRTYNICSYPNLLEAVIHSRMK